MPVTKYTFTSDKKMLLLIEILKVNGVIRFKREFYDAIGILEQNARNIKEGIQHFTPLHIENAIIKYNVNANWIFGIGDQIFLGNKKGHTPHKKEETIKQTDF